MGIIENNLNTLGIIENNLNTLGIIEVSYSTYQQLSAMNQAFGYYPGSCCQIAHFLTQFYHL